MLNTARGNNMSGLLTVFIQLLGCTFASLSRAEELREPKEIKAAPPLQLNDMHGRPHSLADCRGQVVLVNFWAGRRFPCIKEIPDIIRLA